jgi:integrase
VVQKLPERPAGPSFIPARLAYTVFRVAATTGMRCSEILALQWRAVDFAGGVIPVKRAFKGSETGKPK